jgi:hypothetical protein
MMAPGAPALSASFRFSSASASSCSLPFNFSSTLANASSAASEYLV